jgi:hypothetical protein
MNEEKAVTGLKMMAEIMEAGKNPLSFLGLFQREESAGLWDVVVAGPRLKSADRGSYLRIANRVHRVLSKKDWLGVSRIVILDSDSDDCRYFVSLFKGRLGPIDAPFTAPGGAVIVRGWVVVARTLPSRFDRSGAGDVKPTAKRQLGKLVELGGQAGARVEPEVSGSTRDSSYELTLPGAKAARGSPVVTLSTVAPSGVPPVRGVTFLPPGLEPQLPLPVLTSGASASPVDRPR